MKNSQPNFGITLDDLVCFRGVNPSNPNHNRDALSLIRDGIELFEIHKEDLGVPLDILEQGNSVNVLAVYLGLGHLLKNRKIPVTQNEQPEFNLGQETSCGPCKKVEVDYDALLKEKIGRAHV